MMRKKTGFIKLIRLWGVVFLITLAAAIVGIDLVSNYHDFNIRMDSMRTDYIELQKQATKREVVRIVNMINHERTQIGTGLYVNDTEEQVKAAWLERINHVRFGKNLNGYVFAGTWDGISIAHGAQPDLIGKDIWGFEDSRGNKTSQLLIATSKIEGGGFVPFWWKKPDTGQESSKLTYTLGIPDWEILIAAGVYVDDIEEDITTLRVALNAHTKTKILVFIMTIVIVFTLSFILFHLLSNRLRKDLNLFVSFFDQAAFSDKKIDRETVQFVELDHIAESANKMITDRKKAEEEIKSAKLFIDRVVEMSPYAMWISDQKGTVIRTNRSLREALNMTDDMIVGQYNVLKDKNIEIQGVLPMVIAVFENHEPANFSIPWKAAKASDVNFEDARDWYIDVSMFPIVSTEGELTNVVCQWVDITEQKKNEEALQISKKELVAKNKELEQIVYITSHDLRSPLVNVQGFSAEIENDVESLVRVCANKEIPEVVKEKIDSLLLIDIPESLNFIKKSSVKMDALLSGLLRLSRLGRVITKTEKCDMDTLMAEVIATAEFQIKSAGAIADVSPLPSCRGDARLLNQVFSNLIENAIKYFDPDRPGQIQITGHAAKGRAIYSVADNGIGIASEHRDIIFEIFHQLHPDPNPGEGLGLNIVSRILEKQNGKVWLKSEPGKGSTFYVELPG